MNSVNIEHQQIIKAIAELPPEVLPEIASFIEYLQFKAKSQKLPTKTVASGSSFLCFLLATVNSKDKNHHFVIEIARSLNEPLIL